MLEETLDFVRGNARCFTAGLATFLEGTQSSKFFLKGTVFSCFFLQLTLDHHCYWNLCASKDWVEE